jgi:hypothetical protein
MEMITVGYVNKPEHVSVWLRAESEVHVWDCYSRWYLNLLQYLGEDNS